MVPSKNGTIFLLEFSDMIQQLNDLIIELSNSITDLSCNLSH